MKRIKGFALIVKEFPVAASMSKEAMQLLDFQMVMKGGNLAAEVVPCTITYSLPNGRKKTTKRKGRTE